MAVMKIPDVAKFAKYCWTFSYKYLERAVKHFENTMKSLTATFMALNTKKEYRPGLQSAKVVMFFVHFDACV